jgi:methyl-accepting chemotaxis protein
MDLKTESEKAIDNVNNILKAFQDLMSASEKNKALIEEAVTTSGQIQAAAHQSLQNTEESKHAANIINDTISEMADFIEDLAVSADELQQG